MRLLSIILFQFLLSLVVNGQRHDISSIHQGILSTKTPKLSKWKILPRKPGNVPTRDANGLIFGRDIKKMVSKEYGSKYNSADPLIQSNANYQNASSSTPAEIDQDIEGIGFSNIAPADPSLAVGPDHIIQMVNGKDGSAYYRIFQKNNGNILTEGFMDEIPGASYNGAGDCITWYDQFENRFVMTEFGDSSDIGIKVNSLIIAVSATPDPTGEWFIYEFYNVDFFPDYPKYGNWNNAWFGMTRDFKDEYLGSSVWAFDKASMIKGTTSVTAIRFRYTDPDNKFNSLSPVSMDGIQLANSNRPGLFMYYNDDNLTQDPDDVDSLGIIAFEPDFKNPNNSISYFKQSFTVAPFRSNFCLTKSCIPSLTGEGYDAISNRIMNKPYLRKIGSTEFIVCNHTVDATNNNIAGLRWYQLNIQNNIWTLNQQGTYAPTSIAICNRNAPVHRFMGSVAINNAGQIALGFNHGSSNGYASISFTGRNDSDQKGIMTYEETIAKSGEGYGTFRSRWGDYNDITTDVSNDSLFWFTSMYDSPNGWKTKILSFKLRALPDMDATILGIDNPNECEFICDSVFSPTLTIKNNGKKEISQIELSYQLNDGIINKFNWNGKLQITEQLDITLPKMLTPEGALILKIFINSVNGQKDQISENDTASVNIKNTSGRSIPLEESFESEEYLLKGWSKNSTGNPSFNWIKTNNAFKSGNTSLFVNNFNINQPGKNAELKMPFINLKGVDSLALNFWVAAAIYDKQSVDTLEILVSENCETNYRSIWKKWGNDLITRSGEVNTSFVPSSNEWRKINIDLNEYKGKRGIFIVFRNINGYGNNIFLDDISISGKKIFNNDGSLIKILSPDYFTCDGNLKPSVLLENNGNDTIKNISLLYKTDETDWRSVQKQTKIAPYKTDVIELTDLTVSAGKRLLSVAIEKVNETIDQKNDADSLSKEIIIKTPAKLPLSELFTSSDLPNEWNFINETSSTSWISNVIERANNKYSLNLRNTTNELKSSNAYLISPWFQFEKNDSLILSYDYTFGKLQQFDEQTFDTIQIDISKDCGSTFEKVYLSTGNNLLTGFAKPGSINYIPAENHWRSTRINLSEFVRNNEKFILKISCSLGGSSNLYLDNIHVFTSNVPDKLKNDGYMIRPNPFSNGFRIDLFPDAEKLNKIEIYNANGQMVYYSNKNQTPYTNIVDINIPHVGNGLYFVRLFFKDKSITKRLIKAN